MTTETPHRVVIAGGGIAGLETLLALRAFAGARVDVDLICPDPEFSVAALGVEAAFGAAAPRRYSLEAICADHRARFRADLLVEVDRPRRRVALADGGFVAYDSLVVAVGARSRPAYPDAVTFGREGGLEQMQAIVRAMDAGTLRRVAFVVPPEVGWTLPVYELALLTADRAALLGLDVLVTLITHEQQPLESLGAGAGERIADVLYDAGVALICGRRVTDVRAGTVHAGETAIVHADAVVTVPILAGAGIAGLPADSDGFLPVGELCRVMGTDDVFAAGDGTAGPVKQGGLAAQEAVTLARAIAHRAGAAVRPQPLRPVLRGQLTAGHRSIYLREAVGRSPGGGCAVTSDHALWWPPGKLAAAYLSAYLDALDAASAPHGDAAASIRVARTRLPEGARL